jgi:hypothetical protein
MKLLYQKNRRRGAVLAITLVLAALVGIVVGALLLITRQQNYLTARSQTWASEIPIAEAGIEEAMAHINSRPTNWAGTHGWESSGNSYYRQRSLGNEGGYYYTTISTAKPPSIVSIGYGRIPLQSNFTYRTILAVTKLAPPGWGVVGKKWVAMNGNPYIDSYDSSDPNFSTNGLYDVTKRRDRAGVGTLSTNANSITTGSNGKIYGSAATGPRGTVSGTVGDGGWNTSPGTGQQAGHVTDDFNMAVPTATLPANFSATPQTLPVLGYTLPLTDPLRAFTYVLAGGDWKFPGASFSGGGVYIQGSVRIWMDGDFTMSGTATVTLAPGATLEMYIGNPTPGASSVQMDLTGQCVVNPTGIPSKCLIFGLQNCTSMKYAGTAKGYCKLYAPSADITVTGNYDFNGSVVGNTVQFSGTASIHYDEALSGSGPDYRIVSWEEL